eukprot:GFYU01024358.1.p1 GENE.GFYU01024358.1~~GFYU01024358.1.p1  ORF type:complete len:384 (-),score=116.27 GFYU01024358.1:28-1179(-)
MMKFLALFISVCLLFAVAFAYDATPLVDDTVDEVSDDGWKIDDLSKSAPSEGAVSEPKHHERETPILIRKVHLRGDPVGPFQGILDAFGLGGLLPHGNHDLSKERVHHGLFGGAKHHRETSPFETLGSVLDEELSGMDAFDNLPPVPEAEPGFLAGDPFGFLTGGGAGGGVTSNTTATEHIVTFNIPEDFDKQDVHLHIEGEQLQVTAEKGDSASEGEKSETIQESFNRAFAMPYAASPKSVKADFKDHKLIVRFPKGKNEHATNGVQMMSSSMSTSTSAHKESPMLDMMLKNMGKGPEPTMPQTQAKPAHAASAAASAPSAPHPAAPTPTQPHAKPAQPHAPAAPAPAGAHPAAPAGHHGGQQIVVNAKKSGEKVSIPIQHH